MHQQLLSIVLEKSINTVLSLNHHAHQTLQDLNDKTLTVRLSELDFPLSFSIIEEKVLVSSLTERSDCSIHTSLATLKELQQTQQITELIKQDKLDVVGDIKIAQKFAVIAETLAIDWQSELAKHIGDIPTYKLQQFHCWLGEKFNFAKTQISADSREWLVYEKRLVVTQHEIALFTAQVSEVERQMQQLSQRYNKIMALEKNASE